MQEKITQNVNYFPLLSIADILQLEKIQKTKYYATGLTVHGNYPKQAWKNVFSPQNIKQMLLSHFKQIQF